MKRLQWDRDGRIERAREVLGESLSITQAAAKLSHEWGVHVSTNALDLAFNKRPHLGTAGSHLKRYTGAEPPDFEDEPTRVREAPPQPVRDWIDQQPERVPDNADVVSVHVLFPDIHAANQDDRAIACAVKAAQHITSEFTRERRHVVQLGDLLDAEALSAHVRRAPARHSFAEDIEGGKRVLGWFRSGIDAATYTITRGNHDDWFERYKVQRVPELVPFLNIGNLLELEATGWREVGYHDGIWIGRTQVSHEFGKSGPNAPLANLNTQAGKVHGHTHAMGAHFAGGAEWCFRVTASLGWLGRFDSISYMSRAVSIERWCHGFGFGYLDSRGLFWLTPVPIVEGRCVVNGKAFRA